MSINNLLFSVLSSRYGLGRGKNFAEAAEVAAYKTLASWLGQSYMDAYKKDEGQGGKYSLEKGEREQSLRAVETQRAGSGGETQPAETQPASSSVRAVETSVTSKKKSPVEVISTTLLSSSSSSILPGNTRNTVTLDQSK